MRRQKKILIVDNDPSVRTMLNWVLVEEGYQVQSAARPEDGLRIAQRMGASLSLVITEKTLPEMSGPDLVRMIRATNPGMKVLYLAGSAQDDAPDLGLAPSDAHYLKKPFPILKLALKVREALGT